MPKAHNCAPHAIMSGEMTEISKWSEWAEISTVLAATAGLWALWFAWVTYVMSVCQQNKDEFQALRSIVSGLRAELAFIKDWTGTGGKGYSEGTPPPDDWSQPSRLIWKFEIGAVSNLTRSPYLYRLGDIVEPFVQLNLWVSKLFQLYDEYRAFANSNPGVRAAPPPWYTNVILGFNVMMHVSLIGGADSKADCLYKAYNTATSALDRFEARLKPTKLPLLFWIGHVISVLCFASGVFLLYMLFH